MDLKGLVKRKLTARADEVYNLKLNDREISFDAWIRGVENGLERFDMTLDPDTIKTGRTTISYNTHYDGMTVRIFPYAQIGENFIVKNVIEDIIIFVNGGLTDRAVPLIVKAFKANPEVSVVYGDEDIALLRDEEEGSYGSSVYGTRRTPYFKPDWSPNSFLSHFYFCNIVAIRRVSFRELEWGIGNAGAQGLYHTLLRYIYENEDRIYKSVYHIGEILVHAEDYDYNDLTDPKADELARHMRIDSLKNGLNLENPTKITIVIPSKDNSFMLERCISSIYDACPGTIIPEIIVVDNGSSLTERDIIEAIREKLPFRYEYSPMEFNFPRMCNMGAALGTGEFILFLNDDVTFTEPYTLEAMVKEASYFFTGAVGAKLLYPGTRKIQHAGVINNRIGPVHKLQFADDLSVHYHGFNRYVQNVIAVTGACLMVRRSAFEGLGGMNESLRVAFNDVDICFKLYENKYFNVVCNQISLNHAESVSRGKDTDTLSLERLLREKKMLYEEHPALRGYDPFYNRYLVGDDLDTRIIEASEYEYARALEDEVIIKPLDLSGAREDACLVVNVEYAGNYDEYTWDEDSEGLFIQGFSFVTGSDNACYKKLLVLKSDEQTYGVAYEGALRKDVADNCKDQTNVELSGFALHFADGRIAPGIYRVGVLFSHRFAKEKLYSFSNRMLVVK